MGNNINSIINAQGLARKLIDADPYNEGKSLQVPNLVRVKFNEYLSTDSEGNLIPVIMNEEYITRKALEFVHSSFKIPFSSAYRYSEFKGDFSQDSFYDSCERILARDEKIGDCVGLSSVIKYLSGSKGVESKFVGFLKHVALNVKIEGKNIHLESTNPSGFGYVEKRKARNNFEIISQIKSNLGFYFSEDGEFQEAINFCNDSIKINPKNIYAYINRADALIDSGEYKDALLDSTKAIKLGGKNSDLGYRGRALSWWNLGKLENALADLETYASFGENNKRIVNGTMDKLKRLIKKNKDNGK
jgi:tetratricopeptide (TPR) repeat protein